ncbi:MAG: cobalamin B12-binding domain-containing protein [Deltaproteobacteria bacterium]
MKQSAPHILLINPWITDFAAYNLCVRPLGLLRIGTFLRSQGFRISLVDCLDSYFKKKEYGVGKFLKTKISKPYPIKTIPRNYSRYGITEEMLTEKLSAMERPDVIGITSGMIYWYPGLFKTIHAVKSLFKGVPVILGGIYATLCHDHAIRFSGADFVIRGSGEFEIFNIISKFSKLV